jgi:hypothetical protein
MPLLRVATSTESDKGRVAEEALGLLGGRPRIDFVKQRGKTAAVCRRSHQQIG